MRNTCSLSLSISRSREETLMNLNCLANHLLEFPNAYYKVKSVSLICPRSKIKRKILKHNSSPTQIEVQILWMCTGARNNNNNSVYLLSAHSIRFDAHGTNYYYPALPGHHKDAHGKQNAKMPILRLFLANGQNLTQQFLNPCWVVNLVNVGQNGLTAKWLHIHVCTCS